MSRNDGRHINACLKGKKLIAKDEIISVASALSHAIGKEIVALKKKRGGGGSNRIKLRLKQGFIY